MKERKWLLKLEYQIKFKNDLGMNNYIFTKKIKDYPSHYIGALLDELPKCIDFIQESKRELSDEIMDAEIIEQSLTVLQATTPFLSYEEEERLKKSYDKSYYFWEFPYDTLYFEYLLDTIFDDIVQVGIRAVNYWVPYNTPYACGKYIVYNPTIIPMNTIEDLKLLQNEEFKKLCVVNRIINPDPVYITEPCIIVTKPKFITEDSNWVHDFNYIFSEEYNKTEIELSVMVLSKEGNGRYYVPIRNIYHNLMGK